MSHQLQQDSDLNSTASACGPQSEATDQDELSAALAAANQATTAAERAWHVYASLCDVGPERTRAFDVYDAIRQARRG